MKPFALVLALALAGCSKTEPPVVLVTAEPAQPLIAPECTETDRPWLELEDGEARLKQGARNYRQNKDRYNALLGKREICRKSLRAQFPDAAPAKE